MVKTLSKMDCNHGNIVRTKSGKCKTTKDISGCYRYHETCQWNLWKVLVKDYTVYKKWIKDWYKQNFMAPQEQ